MPSEETCTTRFVPLKRFPKKKLNQRDRYSVEPSKCDISLVNMRISIRLPELTPLLLMLACASLILTERNVAFGQKNSERRGVFAQSETSCSGGIDEDGDDVVDCADADCFDSPICHPEKSPEQSDSSCQDFIDNDQDGYLDCEDRDCWAKGITVCIGSWGEHVALPEAGKGSPPSVEESDLDRDKVRLGLEDAIEGGLLRFQNVPRQKRFFRDLSQSLPKEPITAIGVDPGDSESLLVGLDGFVFKSDDRGESWRPVLSFPRGTLDGDRTVQPVADQLSDGSTVLPSKTQQANGAAIIDQMNQNQPLSSDPGLVRLPFDDDDVDDDEDDEMNDDFQAHAEFDENEFGETVWMPEGDDSFFQASDFSTRTGKGVRQIVYHGASKGGVLVGTPRGLFRSRNGGETFSRIELPGGYLANDVRAVAYGPEGKGQIWVGTRVGVFFSADEGKSFQRLSDRAGYASVLSLWVGTVDENDLVLVGTDEGVLRSWDGGLTFHDLLLQGVGAFEPVSVVAFDVRTETTYAGAESGLFVSERGQPILERRPGGKQHPVTDVSIDLLRPNGVAFGFRGEGLFFSENAAMSTLQLGRDLAASNVYGIARWKEDPDSLVIATDRGVFIHAEGKGISVSIDRMRALEDVWFREPTLAETMAMALDYSALDPKAFHSTIKRAQWSALAPEMLVHYGYTLGRPEEEEEYILLIDEPDDFDDGDQKDYIELYDLVQADRAPYRGQVHEFYVSFVWQLDELVFNRDRPLVMQFNALRYRAEMQVLGRVETLYTARQRLMAEILLQEQQESQRTSTAQWLRLAELNALIDGVTGGQFTKIADQRGADPNFIHIFNEN